MTMIQVAADTLQEVVFGPNNTISGQLAAITVARTGHYVVHAHATHQGTWYSSGGDPFITIAMGGTAPLDSSSAPMSQTTNGTTQGLPVNMSGGMGYVWHGALTAGQTITMTRTSYRCENAPSSGRLWAHFVPTPTIPK